MRRRVVLALALATVLAAREASGDIYHLKSPSTLETQRGSKLTLPPGYFLDERTWQDRDAELKRLQEADTRRKAENESLRKSADEIPWKVIASALVFGAFVGYLSDHMTK